MCGIAAILRLREGAVSGSALLAMTEDVAHRGPDGAGQIFLTPTANGFATSLHGDGPWTLGLGHRRLSILDLSLAGAQPMERDGLWITYNGEIYNYVELRDELLRAGATFRSASDTEVILAAYEAFGTSCFARMKGMWGLVLVDTRQGRVVVSRDRLGIKPLYIFRTNDLVAFSSEIKQLFRVMHNVRPHVRALDEYLKTGYERTDATFFEDVVPAAAGHVVTYDLHTGACVGDEPYWRPETIAPTIRDRDEAAFVLRRALSLSVKQHLRSDVPVGCALSGGLDSSAVAALVHVQKPLAFKTFTATFPNAAIDERAWVERVLGRVDAMPFFVTPTPERFLEDLDAFVWMHDEPVGSMSQYACWCIARLTRHEGVPVTLNGQGGDEVLSGYWQSYFMHLFSLGRGRNFPLLVRHFAGAALRGNRELFVQVPVMARRLIRRGWASRKSSNVIGRVFEMSDQERRVFQIRELFLPRLLKWDDRNFMAHSVEGRYPFLDHELIETALSIVPEALYDGGWLKEPLRRGLSGLLPDEVVRRRDKLGFETPQANWLHGRLRPKFEAMANRDLPVWRFVDFALGQRALSAASHRASEETSQLVVRLFFANAWLERFFDGGRVKGAPS